MPVDILATPRLRLRTADRDDADFYLALVNDRGFLEHIGDRGIRTREDVRGHSLYVVELKDSGTPIGMCGLIKRETLDGVDIGYAYLARYCGRGYAYEAGMAVLALAPALGLRRVLAITSPNNLASNGLLRKMGMRYERFVHLVPGDAGSNLYSMEF